MSVASRCGRCARAVSADAAFCPACGAGLRGEVLIELDGASDASEVVFEPAGGGRRVRWVGAGVAAALVVAVAASVAAGGDDQAAPTTTAPRTTVARTSTSTTEPATTAAPAAPTTSTTIRVRSDAGVPLLGEPTGVRLLLVVGQGLLRLDLDTGVATVADPAVFSDDIAAVPGGVVSVSGGEFRVVPDGGRPLEAQAREGQLLGTDSAGRAWMLVYPDDAGPRELRVLTVADAASPPTEVELPWATGSWPVPNDVGGVVMSTAGGVYRWAPGEEPRPVAPGILLDAQGRFALTRICYPEPTCRLVLTDLVTGASRSSADPGATQPAGVRISPDGAWLLRDSWLFSGDLSSAAPPITLTPVDGGNALELPVRDDSPIRTTGARSRFVWSPDGHWLFYASGLRVLSAWRPGLAAPIDIELPDLVLRGPLGVVVPP